MMAVEEGATLVGAEDDYSLEDGLDGDANDSSSHPAVMKAKTARITKYSGSSSESEVPGGNPNGSSSELLLVDNIINNTTDSQVMVLTFVLAMGNAADAIEIMCIGFIMTEIPDITSMDKEYLSAAVFFGMLFGGIICGFLSDYVGRKPCLLYSLGLNTLAGFASAIVPNVKWLIFCRVIGGIGIGGSVPAVFSMGAEMFPASVRGKLLSVVASFWMVGAIFTASAAWLMLGDDFSGQKIMTTSWRSFAAVCATPALVTFFMTFFLVTESPRYLMGKKRFSEAARALEFASGVPVRASDLMGKATSEGEPRGGSNSSAGGHSEKSNETGSLDWLQALGRSTFAQLFSPMLIRTTVVLLVIWFTLCFGSYGISTWISELFNDIGESNAYADAFIFALANLPGNLISIYYVETYGRKRLLTWGMSLSAVAALGFAIDTKQKVTVVLFAALFNAFSTVGWNSLDCMSVESFPTNVRTSAMGVLAAAGRLGAISAQFVNGSMENNVPLLLCVTSTCMVVGGAASYLLDNDHTGTTLAEVPEDVKPMTKTASASYASLPTTSNPLQL